MNLLLDTNALVWATDSSKEKSIGKTGWHLIRNSDVTYASSLSVVELRMKEMNGKLELPPNFVEEIRDTGMVLLEFNATHAEAISNFPILARHDPFDRMLLAQAQAEGLLLLTADTILLSLGVSFVIDVRE